MANAENILVFKKMSNDATFKDSLTEWNMVVIEEPMLFATDTKDAAVRDWLDEDGVEVYPATRAYLKDFDVDIKCGIKSDNTKSCQEYFKSLLEYLTQGGILHNIYCPWVAMGRTNVRYKGASNFEYTRFLGNEYMTFELKLHVADPVTDFSIPATSVTMAPSTVSMNIGDSITLDATPTPYYTSTRVSWSSTNANVAEVVDGRVYAKSAGSATIKATYGTKTATCSVTVS